MVYPIPTERKTESGIILHDESAKREDMAQIKARVISIGDTCWYDKPGSRHWAKVGDTVLIAKYSGLYLQGEDGLTYRIINDLDIVAVKEGD